MSEKLRFASLVALVAVLASVVLVGSRGVSTASSAPVGNNVLSRARDVALGHQPRDPRLPSVSGGVLFTVLDATGEWTRQLQAANPSAARLPSAARTQGCQNVYTNPTVAPNNTRVNQDCSLRRQAEEVIVVNPTNPSNLVAGQNDSRIGYNHCGYDWSMDGGRTWGDQVPPFYQFALGDGHVADACSDPTATFDAQGNAYVGGVLFDINSPASAFVVAKSNAPIGGAFYHSPVSQTQQIFADLPLGVIASDNDPNIFNDKEFIVADTNPSSPKANYVYGTWTRFNLATGAGIGANSPIYFSQSTDGGATWSPGIEISGANAAVCTGGISGETNPHACDQDQGSDPIVGPDGTIYVTFNNFNTQSAGTIDQYLIVSCPATKDCSNPASWTRPMRIAHDFATQPIGPNTTTGCPAGYQCLPPNGYRMGDQTAGSVSIDRQGRLYFVWADFRNGGGTCVGNAATATPPCNNDVFFVVSTDGGMTWTQPTNLTPAASFGQTAQWMPWSMVNPSGTVLWVAYYDRSYGTCEFDGCNDITLAKVQNPASPSPTITYQRITTASMPNLTPANNVVQAGFIGDYMWVTSAPGGAAYLVWADTRGLNGNVEEDIYVAKTAS